MDWKNLIGENIVLLYGFKINVWLALFNMIPVWNFDGSKILKWNKYVYGIFIIICLVLFIL